jgi:hypothetical protein
MAKNKLKKRIHTPSVASSAAPVTTYNAAGEMTVVRHDMIQTILVNALFIGILLALYYWNRGSHTLDTWISHVVKL